MDIVVGGSGFLGQNLARKLLKENRDVLICDKKIVENTDLQSVPFRQIDVTQPATLDSIGAGPEDTVYHFAANLLVPIPPRRKRHDFFFDVIFGVRIVIGTVTRKKVPAICGTTASMRYSFTTPSGRTCIGSTPK